jgi:hypothetical protein
MALHCDTVTFNSHSRPLPLKLQQKSSYSRFAQAWLKALAFSGRSSNWIPFEKNPRYPVSYALPLYCHRYCHTIICTVIVPYGLYIMYCHGVLPILPIPDREAEYDFVISAILPRTLPGGRPPNILARKNRQCSIINYFRGGSSAKPIATFSLNFSNKKQRRHGQTDHI